MPEHSWRRIPSATSAIELNAAELTAIADVWKRNHRTFLTRFGGTSMLPTIAPQQEVLLECTEDVSAGDVIAYIYLDQVVVHRLMFVGSQFWLTRGDARALPDPPLRDRSRIVGRVVSIVREGEDVTVPDSPATLRRLIGWLIARTAAAFGPRAVERATALFSAC